MIVLFKEKIEGKLAELVAQLPSFYPSLLEAARYALLAPGKRIRPLLTLCAAEMLQEGAHECALVPACALEMVHTYSLIHDDLPCMDNDDFRRGKPTLHRVYSEGHAVLVGDYLLTYAFESIAQACMIQPDQKVELVQKLAQAAGGNGMIGGQIMDIEHSDHIEEMHARKTAALFCAAVEFGGIVVRASSQIMQILRSFGMQFGKLFQMVDDILDADHPLGMEKAQNGAEQHFEHTIKILLQLPYNTVALKNLTELVFHAWKQKFSLLEK